MEQAFDVLVIKMQAEVVRVPKIEHLHLHDFCVGNKIRWNRPFLDVLVIKMPPSSESRTLALNTILC